jgi:hypothetical protein
MLDPILYNCAQADTAVAGEPQPGNSAPQVGAVHDGPAPQPKTSDVTIDVGTETVPPHPQVAAALRELPILMSPMVYQHGA